jgi:thiosulfate/3-mercaptopyruvate sulfurtransferase
MAARSFTSRWIWLVAVMALTSFGAVSPVAAGEVKPLVSTTWLKANLSNADLVVLDVRSALDGGGAEAYRKGHIPGAIHSDYDKAGWRVTRNGIPFMVPNETELEKLIGELGIDEENHVVVVPAGVHATDFGAAARVYWTFKYAGHDKVSILDGGFAAWTADPSNPVETGARAPSPKIFTVSLNKSLLADISDVEAAVTSGKAALVDARGGALFAGKDKADRIAAYGHIPGAINVDNASLYDPAKNRLRPRAELASYFTELPSDPVTTYCNTGHWAATDWFVLSELLGRKDAKLYAGSMIEWSADPGRPVQSQRTRWDDLKKRLGLGS